MAQPKRGEVWLADLGLAAKVRPVLVARGADPIKGFTLLSKALQSKFLKSPCGSRGSREFLPGPLNTLISFHDVSIEHIHRGRDGIGPVR